MPLQSYRIVDNIPGKEVWTVVVEDWDDQLLKHIDKLERKHYDSVKDAKQALRKMFSGRGGVVRFKGRGVRTGPGRRWATAASWKTGSSWRPASFPCES